jgi:hypothetical protein
MQLNLHTRFPVESADEWTSVTKIIANGSQSQLSDFLTLTTKV